MEILDVINIKDEVIGEASKDECHQRGLRHRSVFVFIFDNNDNLILQKRSSKKKIRPNKITASACGHVVKGENYLKAAERELLEELGIKTNLIEVLRTIGPYDQDKENIVLYEGHYEGDLDFNKEEIAEIIKMSVNDIKDKLEEKVWNFGSSFKKVFLEYINNKNI
jgi:isopentenyl-diphosphate Delta-isomerase